MANEFEQRQRKVTKAHAKAMYDYQALPYSGRTVLFCDQEESHESGWSSLATGIVETYTIPGDHFSILREPNVLVLAKQLEACL